MTYLIACISTTIVFLAYGTYDFTNMATLKNWPTIVSVVGITWGTTLTGVIAMLGYFITLKNNSVIGRGLFHVK